MSADQEADLRRERCYNLNQLKYQLEGQIKATTDPQAASLLRKDYREVIDELDTLERKFIL